MRSTKLFGTCSRLIGRAQPSVMLLALAAAVAGSPGALFAQGSPQPVATLTSLLPESFSGVNLGMSQAELRQRRAGIVTEGFKGDNVGHSKVLIEKVNSAFFDRVIYLFNESAPTLAGVICIKALPLEDPAPAARSFRSAALKKWGIPTDLGFVSADGGEKQIALIWKRMDGVVIASYPIESGKAASVAARGRSAFVRIGRRGSEVEVLADRREALEGEAAQKLGLELRDDLAKAGTVIFR